MSVVLTGVSFIIATGLFCLFIKNGKICTRVGATGLIAGFVPIVLATIKVLYNGTAISLRIPWQVPYGSFYVELDSISSFFLIVIFISCSTAAIYGCGYMVSYKGRRLGIPTLFFNLLAAGMILVVLASNSILFLMAWEIMSLASYFLVTFDDERESVRQAGWIYLVATHIGTAFLLVFFVVLSAYSGSPDFDRTELFNNTSPAALSGLFLLALVGFGTKAGIMPLHVWLPEAHPAAPSHVSAVMSGVMIKMGIYGIIRTLLILPNCELWWGYLLIGIGAVSGILGVLLAIAQHDIKRLLAYHSVENIGIIVMGLGIGVLGTATHSVGLAVAGFAGAILHIINHAIFKGLLFLGAGSVVHAAGTREIDKLGGIAKSMQFTAGAFLIGAIAICGLPPLNGFVSEFLIYTASFKGCMLDGVISLVPAAAVIGALAIIGTLATACFTKVFGIVFLGEPRSEHIKGLHESPASMCVPIAILALCCFLIGLGAPAAVMAIKNAVIQLNKFDAGAVVEQLEATATILLKFVMAIGFLFAFIIIITLLRNILFITSRVSNKTQQRTGRTIEKGLTWDCGYAAPTVRMQYTGSSFAQSIIDMFKNVLHSRSKTVKITELFPEQAQFESHTPDASSEYLYRPVFKWVDWVISKMRWVQYGVVQMYVLYIAITLIILLIWKL